MPELPEVETLRRTLTPLLGLRVTRAHLLRADILFSPSTHSAPTAMLQGDRLTAIDRRGKQLALIGASGRALVIQLGMSGQLLLGADSPHPSHTHAVWHFDSGAALLFRDPRRFGGLTSLPSLDALIARWHTLGPDGLHIRTPELIARAGASRRTVKAALLDQSVLAGVGNIYADESLFLAGVHPAARCDRLKPEAWARIAEAIRLVLARAIEARGSTLRDYRDASGAPGAAQNLHRVYGRAGLPCLACTRIIRSMMLAQRTTCFCPHCQPVRGK